MDTAEIPQIFALPAELDDIETTSTGVNYRKRSGQIAVDGHFLWQQLAPTVVPHLGQRITFGPYTFELVAQWFAGDTYIFRLVEE